MTAADDTLCRHCLLPVGRRAMQRTVNGESCAFCCYGCCIAHQVKSGSREEHEAAWLLVRIGVGGFLSMNIMLFSLLLYTDAFAGADAEVSAVDPSPALAPRHAGRGDSRRPVRARDLGPCQAGAARRSRR